MFIESELVLPSSLPEVADFSSEVVDSDADEVGSSFFSNSAEALVVPSLSVVSTDFAALSVSLEESEDESETGVAESNPSDEVPLADESFMGVAAVDSALSAEAEVVSCD